MRPRRTAASRGGPPSGGRAFTHAAVCAVVAAALALSACGNSSPFKPKPAPAPECPQYADFLHTIAVARPTGSALGAAVSGDVLAAAGGADGVSLFDISNPADVRAITTLPALSDARDVAASGPLLFVANGGQGLAVVDIAAPAAAQVIGTVAMPGHAVDVAVDGGNAFVANDAIGLVVVDVSTPAAPAIVGIENTPGMAAGVAARGPLAFVADMTDGLRIVNVSDPTLPFIVRTLTVPGTAVGVAVDKTLVAVAARGGGLQLVDVSTPSTAAIVGATPTAHDAISVAIGSGVVYAGEGSIGFEVFDVSDPSRPSPVETVGTASFTREVALDGDRLAVADDIAGVRALTASRAAPPPGATTIPGIDGVGVAPFGDLALVADAGHGLRVVDPAAGAVIGDVTASGTPVDVAVVDSVAYLPQAEGGTAVVDLHDPTSPRILSTIPTPAGVDRIAVKAPFVYLVASGSQLIEQRIDGTGVPRSYFGGDVYFPSLAIEDPYIYLPDRRGNLWLIVRATMQAYTALGMDGSAERIVLHREDGPLGPGSRLLATIAISGLINGHSNLECWDLTNLLTASMLWRVACGGTAVDVARDGQHLVVPEGPDGLELMVPDTPNPRPVGFIPGNAGHACIAGGRLVAVGGPAGVTVAPLEGCLR